MRYNVLWHTKASEEVANIVVAVKSSMGSNAAKKVIAKFREIDSLLSSNPYLGTEDKDNPPFRIVHSWHNRIYYIFDNEKINIIAVWDNRQDDTRIPDMLARRSSN